MILHSWNVNGLRAVMKKDFFESMNKLDSDILCLQETKLQEDQIPPEIHKLENTYWSFAERKGYSGVAVLSRKQPNEVSTSLGEERFDAEGRVLRLVYDDFILYNVYFPNGKMSDERLQYKLDFYELFLEKMEQDHAEGHCVLVCGDYNTAHHEIDLANPKSNEDSSGFLPVERAWMDKLVDRGWVDTFRRFDGRPEQYSWWSYRFKARERNVGWRIDYFFVHQKHIHRVKDAFIRQDIMGSDHCPVGIEFE